MNILHVLNQHNINDFEKLRKKEQRKLETNSDVEYLVVKKYFYANNKYTFEVSENEVVLNCTRKYVGWYNYSQFIKIVLDFLTSIQVKYQSIEMQYISAFPDTDIFGSVDGDIKLNRYPRLEGTQFSFSMPIGDSEQRYNPIYSKVVLTNYVQDKKDGQNQRLSYVDVNLQSVVGDMPVNEVVAYIHEQEKNLFFSMLSKSFIDSLEPIYK
jgi:uncharacterized protein (TIGR04255 family)